MNKINKINVCCQKVLPLVYDESLSYYEVLCKVIQKLNELIKINNNIRDEIHKEYVDILETAKQVTEAVASVTSMRDEVLTLKQATEQYAHDVVTVYNQTVEARDTAIAKAESAEQSASTASAKADIAQASATTATEKADIAVKSANTATQKADSASQSATVATTKASEAQTSATIAKQYADEAKESASLVGQDVTQLKQDVSNLQSAVSRNTSNISSLNTKVTTNTSNISSLTTKVDNNTSQITTLHSMLAVYWKTLYPIGSIYISTNPTFNPQTTWGGTWKKTADGRCLIGANDTYPIGSIGGSTTHKHATKDHNITTEEMPAHVHSFSKPAWTNKEYVAGQTYLCSYGWSSVSTETFGSTNYTGGSKPHNHGDTGESSSLQPYLSVYIWERTA